MIKTPNVNELVEITFTGDYDSQSPVRGKVVEVDDDPEDIPETEMVFVIEESTSDRKLMYGEGSDWANVTVVNRNLKLGEKAEWRRLD